MMQVESNSSEILDLAELAEKHALDVPFRIRVVNGFMTADNAKDPTFSVDEIYSVHLVKETKVLKANWEGIDYFIPINSSATFGLIQGQDEYNSQLFSSIRELLDHLPQPIVAAALSNHTDRTGVLLLRKNDILVIRSSGKKKIKSSVKAYNISMQKQVSLDADADIKFTINPSSILLYLPDLIEHIDLPRSCIMSSNSTSISTLRTSSRIELVELQTQRSVLVSLFRSNPKSKQKKEINFIEVPTRINIIVKILDDSNEEGQVYQQLLQESRELLHDYNPAKIQACMDSENDSAYMTQAQLLAEVRKEREKQTLTRLAPQNYEEIIIGDQRCDPEPPSSPTSNQSVVPKKLHAPLPPSIPKKPPASAARQPLPPPPFSQQPQPAVYKELDPASHLSNTQYEETYFPDTLSGPSSNNDRNFTTPTSTPSNKPVEKTESVLKAGGVPPKVRPRRGLVMYEEIDQVRPLPQTTHEPTHNAKVPKKEPPQLKKEPPQILKKEPPQILKKDSPQIPKKDPPRIPKRDPSQIPKKDLEPQQAFSTNYTNTQTNSALNSDMEETKNIDKLQDVCSQIQDLFKKMENMENLFTEMMSRQTNMEKELRHLASTQKEKKKTPLAIYRDFSPTQILEVLEAAGLSQYIQAFDREMIDGEIYSDLDEDTLAEELGVASKIHRMRLMKLFQEK